MVAVREREGAAETFVSVRERFDIFHEDDVGDVGLIADEAEVEDRSLAGGGGISSSGWAFRS